MRRTLPLTALTLLLAAPPAVAQTHDSANCPGHPVETRTIVEEPISRESFSLLLNQVKDEASTGRLTVIARLPRRGTFSCAQVASLLELFPFSSDRLTVVEMLAPRISDPLNSSLILQQFKFTSERDLVTALFLTL